MSSNSDRNVVPAEVLSHLRTVFAGCNARITGKMARNPNLPEESFDTSWIEYLQHFSTPIEHPSGWLTKIECHFLGGMRHFRGWEIADIGVLVFIRPTAGAVVNKVALLQSKRLYPSVGSPRVETQSDFLSGFGRLADPEDSALSLGLNRTFRFTEASRYQEIKLDSDQFAAIAEYEASGLHVYYQLYNPPELPFEQEVPRQNLDATEGAPTLGVRILPSRIVREATRASGRQSPSVSDLGNGEVPLFSGWRLEEFICDELLACREGDHYDPDGPVVFNLFNRRSGPIAAAIAITIEGPADSNPVRS